VTSSREIDFDVHQIHEVNRTANKKVRKEMRERIGDENFAQDEMATPITEPQDSARARQATTITMARDRI